MTIFLALLLKIIPLYIIIGFGYIAGKYLHVKKESIATVAIYTVTPIVIFNGTYSSPITISTLSLPILSFAIACFLCIVFYCIGQLFFQDSTKNLLAFTAGEANTGYFGLPVAIALFNQHLVAIYTVAILGLNLFENSLGFFIAARGHHTAQEACIRLLKLPTIYAFFLGLLVNAFGIHLGPIYTDFATSFRGAYLVLGMMIIGLGLAGITQYEFDIPFVSLSFLAKFVAWPVLMLAVFFIDSHLFHLYNAEIHKILLLLSIVPLAANIVAFTTQLKLHPEKASMAVLLSTLFALVYIPLIAVFFLR